MLHRWLFAATLTLACGERAPSTSTFDRVAANDNRRAAGRIQRDTLHVTLVGRASRWYPEADSGPFLDVHAIGVEGAAPQVPAPLLRVPAGTTIRATVRNALSDSTLTVFGLQTRPMTVTDSIILRPGESRTVTFAAGAPGTYSYFAKAGHLDWSVRERETMVGAFIVDSAGAGTDDRVFVLSIYSETDSTQGRNAFAINGRAWPYTERMSAAIGDTLRWRWINGTVRPHPMHLHGFYFTVTARGEFTKDSTIAPDERPKVVTEVLQPFETRSIAWVPEREGNWLFHCHIGFHVVPEARLTPAGQHATLSHDAGEHMAGLVLGIVVHGKEDAPTVARAAARRLDLYVQEGKRRSRAPRAMGYVLGEGGRAPRPDSIGIAGPVLALTRGEPTDIVVHNRLREVTAVHWHGIELESYSDGVAGWSGFGSRVAPPVAPADSFTARLTLPRAGTFMYHTHLGDLEQLTSGLYGPLVVLEPGQRFDPTTDHVYTAGWDGLDDPRLLVNGDSLPKPAVFAFGVTHRLRFINIGAADSYRVRLTRDTSLVTWRAVAQDGADLPPRQAVEGPATYLLDVGQTADFLFTPPRRGEYRLTFMMIPPFGNRVIRILVR